MKMTKPKIKKLAGEIRQWLLDHDMWIDTRIYFNGVAYATDDGNGHNYYNDPKHLIELPDEDPKMYFEYVGPYLSMSFEGPLYDVLNGYMGRYGYKLEEEFHELLKRYGVYPELGNSWNLSVYDL